LFACSPVHARLPAVGRKRHEAKVARAGMLTVNARDVVVVVKGKSNAKMERWRQ